MREIILKGKKVLIIEKSKGGIYLRKDDLGFFEEQMSRDVKIYKKFVRQVDGEVGVKVGEVRLEQG